MSNANVDRITIKGAPPAWSDEEYQRRLDIEVHAYNQTTASLEMVRAPLEYDWLALIIEKSKQGYTINTRQRIQHDMLNHTVWMNKPDDVRAKDIESLKEKVKADYVEHLEAEHKRYQELLREQLVQAAEEKERQDAQAKQAKKLKAIDDQVAACYSPLVIPDGTPSPKAAVFSTDME